MTTSERIRRWREWAGLSRHDVAQNIGITSAAISYWETGIVSPRPANLEKFVDLIGISLERFYGSLPRRRKEVAP